MLVHCQLGSYSIPVGVGVYYVLGMSDGVITFR